MGDNKCIIDKYNTVYCFDVYVVLHPDKDTIDKQFEWRENGTSILEDKYGSYSAYTVSGAWDKAEKKDCVIIVINTLKDDNDNINTFAHESLHAAMDILSTCGIKYSEDSCEAYAYLVGYITECVYRTAKKI